MKLSLNWLKQYLTLDYTNEKLAEMLTTIGLEVEGIEKVESVKGGLNGVVVGHVLTCDKHPDADRLSLTTVNIGNDEPLNIVCGAPNVAVGQKVMVATIGAELHFSNGESITIKKGKIRGQDSHGMICALDELGLGSDHSGIIVLPEATEIGIKASEYYNLIDDCVFEIGLTPNRSDATSQLGVARDLYAYLKVNENYDLELIEPDHQHFSTSKVSYNIEVEIEDKAACPRYSGIMMSGIEVKESPEWLKKHLISIGVKPINNVVDVTNYVLNEYGQPLHAFDADKIAGKKIIVGRSTEGMEFVTLDSVNRKLSSSDLVIFDGARTPMCLAGVYGGLASGVNVETKNLFLESAFFDAKMIRKTSTKYNLRTDAAKIYEKGADPNITIQALKRACSLLKGIAGGEISNYTVDLYPREIKPIEIRLYYSNVNKLIGNILSEDTIYKILRALSMEISPIDDDSLMVKIPTNKVDVTREVDLIEEIVRIYGLDRIEIPQKIQSTISYSAKPDKHKFKEMVSDHLSSIGFNEMMGLSLIESRLYQNISIEDAAKFVFINNTSNIHLDIMRPEMLLSGLISVSYNLNRQQNTLSMYEFGKAYLKNNTTYQETELLTLFMVGKQKEESWTADNKATKSFFDLKQAVQSVLSRLSILDISTTEITESTKWAYGLDINFKNKKIVSFGLVKKEITQKMGVKSDLHYAEFFIENILSAISNNKINVKEITKFPTIRRDLALVLDKNIKFEEIEQIARQTDKKMLRYINLFDVYENEKQLGENKKSYSVSYHFESVENTPQDKDVDKIMSRLITQYEDKLKAFIRK